MRLAEADRRVDVERIEARSLAERRLGDLRRAGVRHAVRRADDEAVERVARIERRALEAADAGASGCRNGGDEHRAALAVARHAAPLRAPFDACSAASAVLDLRDVRWRCCPAGAATTSTFSAPLNSARQQASRSSE